MRTSKLNCFNEDQDWTNDEIWTILGCVMWQQSQSYLVCVIPKKTVVATHENYDSAISSLIVQVTCCVWLPVLGRSSTWPIKKKTRSGRCPSWSLFRARVYWAQALSSFQIAHLLIFCKLIVESVEGLLNWNILLPNLIIFVATSGTGGCVFFLLIA